MWRRADELEHDQADENDSPAHILDQLKAMEVLRGRRRTDEREGDEAAEPDNERGQRHIPDRKHAVIIIAGLDATTLDRLTDRVVDAIGVALARDETVPAAALQLLLRRYSDAARADVAESLGDALAKELDRQTARGRDDDPEEWMVLLSEAATVSDDPRLVSAAAALMPAVRQRWLSVPLDEVHVVMHAVDACLRSVNVPEARDRAAEAIDALEQVVARSYRPGQGMSHEIAGGAVVRGGLPDHVRPGSALLTAYMLTGRLPYAMLADELMQTVLKTPEMQNGSDAVFTLRCELVRVFCRLAALHRDDEYRRTAVLAVDTDYAADARRQLLALEPLVPHPGFGAAPFGLALAEWLKVR